MAAPLEARDVARHRRGRGCHPVGQLRGDMAVPAARTARNASHTSKRTFERPESILLATVSASGGSSDTGWSPSRALRGAGCRWPRTSRSRAQTILVAVIRRYHRLSLWPSVPVHDGALPAGHTDRLAGRKAPRGRGRCYSLWEMPIKPPPITSTVPKIRT